MALGQRGSSGVAHRSCIVVRLSQCIVPSTYRMGSFGRSSTDILVVVREGSRRSVVWSSRASCDFACRHEPCHSLVCIDVHSVYLLRTTRYSGHCRSSDADVLYE
mgnify:CR=1 FL=1